MALLPCKASFVRSFLFLIRARRTDDEKNDIAWLDTCVKSRVEMTITPYHKGNVAELGAVVQPKWSKLFPFDFANLESKSDFDQTYKSYEDGESTLSHTAFHSTNTLTSGRDAR